MRQRPRNEAKERSKFSEGAPIEQTEQVKFANPARVVEKSKNKSEWVLKEDADLKDQPVKAESEAYLEVYAQEFMRLIYGMSSPLQPKTRVVKGEDLVGVLSKRVNGLRLFAELPEEERKDFSKNIKNGTYKGLGEVLVTALLLGEADLREENIGLDENNNVIKIDGGWSFTEFKYTKEGLLLGSAKYDVPITQEALENPFSNIIKDWESPPRQYKFFGKYEITEKEEENKQVGIARVKLSIDPDLAQDPHLRQEINFALLKILVSPNQLIGSFLDAYSQGNVNLNLVHFFEKRITELRKVALANKSFLEYLNSEKARRDLEDYKKYLFEFKTSNNKSLLTNEKVNTEEANHTLEEAKRKMDSLIENQFSSLLKPPSNEKKRTPNVPYPALQRSTSPVPTKSKPRSSDVQVVSPDLEMKSFDLAFKSFGSPSETPPSLEETEESADSRRHDERESLPSPPEIIDLSDEEEDFSESLSAEESEDEESPSDTLTEEQLAELFPAKKTKRQIVPDQGDQPESKELTNKDLEEFFGKPVPFQLKLFSPKAADENQNETSPDINANEGLEEQKLNKKGK